MINNDFSKTSPLCNLISIAANKSPDLGFKFEHAQFWTHLVQYEKEPM